MAPTIAVCQYRELESLRNVLLDVGRMPSSSHWMTFPVIVRLAAWKRNHGSCRISKQPHRTRSLEAQGGGGLSNPFGSPGSIPTRPMGRVSLTVFAGLSELDSNLIKDRTEEGQQLARHPVRAKTQTHMTPALRSGPDAGDGPSIRTIARRFHVGVAPIDRIKSASL